MSWRVEKKWGTKRKKKKKVKERENRRGDGRQGALCCQRALVRVAQLSVSWPVGGEEEKKVAKERKRSEERKLSTSDRAELVGFEIKHRDTCLGE